MRLSSLLVAIGFSFAAALAAAACIQVEYGDQPFLCDPGGAEPRCPDSYQCCSDDPAAMTAKGNDLVSDPGALPGINKHESDGKSGKDGFGVPLFAGDNNGRGDYGVCVKPGSMELAFTGTAVVGCPIPCNPQWSNESVETVCGKKGAVCCQTIEIGPKDCVQDDVGCWHTATGKDALDGNVQWPKALDTPQSHSACKDNWKSGSDAYRQCVMELGVASSRGFCIAPGTDGKSKACPLAGKADACEQKNAGSPDCN